MIIKRACFLLGLLVLMGGCDLLLSQDHSPARLAVQVVPQDFLAEPYVFGETAIYLFSSTGEETPIIVASERLWSGWDCPSWSPDGHWLALVNQDIFSSGPEGNLFIVNEDNSMASELATTHSCVAWSPDGKKIVFLLYDTLYSVDIDTGAQTAITRMSGVDSFGRRWAPSWSPDGTKIIYSTGDAVYEMRPDGTGVTQLIGPCKGCWYEDVYYSPDGRWIAFVWHRLDERCPTIYRMKPNGSGVTQLRLGENIAWSPNSDRIAFRICGKPEIYEMGADGANPTVLLPQSQRWRYGDFDWMP